MTEQSGTARRGRRPGRSQTKESILDCARRLFATDGFDHTSIRAIADEAGVDSALVLHYFSSKEGLFKAAIAWPLDMDEKVRLMFEGDPEHMGERLVGMVCRAWDSDDTRHPLTVLLRNAVQGEGMSRLAADFIEREIIGKIVARSADPAAALRGSLAHSVIMGLVIARYVVRVEPLASLASERVIALVAPALQHYLTGDLEVVTSRGQEG